MQFDSYCSLCMLGREVRSARKYLDPEQADAYIREVMGIMATVPRNVSAPYLIPLFADLMAKYGVTGDLYAQEKKDSNDYVLSVLPEAEKITMASADPLLTALKYAQVGNFMDFGVLTKEDVDEKLGSAVASAPEAPLDETEYRNFTADLAKAKLLLILGDNAGEIAFDTLLVRVLKERYPLLRTVYCVRGGNALNDATREDASYVGMDSITEVIDNGTRISATELDYIGPELRSLLAQADIILAKGQANFESMAMSGYNIYYNFLCKCDRLCRILEKPMFTGCFLNERRLPRLTPFPV